MGPKYLESNGVYKGSVRLLKLFFLHKYLFYDERRDIAQQLHGIVVMFNRDAVV